jgi:ankyrin repeat protein
LIQNLLYSYYLDETNKLSEKNANNVKEMINVVIDSGKFDLNFIDDNEDTAINIACTNPNMLWLVEKLAARKDINVNCVNDIGWTSLGNALRFGNIEALKFLGKRPDLVVSDKDRELAKKKGIKLDDFIKPTPFNETTESVVKAETVTTDVEDADKYNEIFKKVFSA